MKHRGNHADDCAFMLGFFVVLILIGAFIAMACTGCARIKDLIDDETEDSIPAIQDEIDPGVIHWMGPRYGDAEIVYQMAHTVMDNDWIYFGSPAPTHWPKQGSGVVVQGIACLFYEIDGRIQGGKFEWVRPGQTRKSLNNVKEGYGGHVMPEPGAKVYACIVSIDGASRSNIVEVERR